MKCQCEVKGVLNSFMAGWYDPVKELPYVAHEPNECKCTNELTKYIRNDVEVYLCSNCNIPSDERV